MIILKVNFIKNYIGTYFNQFNYDNIKSWTIKKPL